MKRMPSRAPSPTPTAFSGISNYKTDSYRPIRDKAAPAVPTIDYRTVSRTHFDELSRYLVEYLARSPPNARASARQKLTRLTIQQFHELSTDVYDELVRRQNEGSAPFLPVRQDFHPKRNQARQKLATLPAPRFEDLSSDVYFELARRYPEFKEDPTGGSYKERPSGEYSSSPPRVVDSRASGRSADQQYDSGYGGSISSRRPSGDRRRPSEDIPTGRRSEDTLRRFEDSYGGRTSDDSSSPYPTQSRRKASQDIVQGRDYPRRPSNAVSSSGTNDSGSTVNQNNIGNTAASAMIIPNKSTIEEEYIEVPYGQDIQEAGSRDRSREVSGEGRDNDLESVSDYPSPLSPPAGLSGLSARLQEVDRDDDPRTRTSEEYFDNKFGRNNGPIDRATSNPSGGRFGASQADEQLKQEYEGKIAAMQSQITSLQRDLGDADEATRKQREAEERVQQLEDELDGLRQRAEEQSVKMRALQRDLEEARELRQRDREDATARARDAEDEIQALRDRCERLEDEGYGQNRNADPDSVEQLRSDMEGLILELNDLSRRNDELMNAKDSDLNVIRDLDSQLKDYKRKYEQAKTELRSVKATSQIYLQAPRFDKSEDQLPVSPDGAILDMHITAFLSAIDGLLTAGRSNAPTKVLTPMKSVINAVTAITDDIRVFERRPARDRSDVDLDVLKSLRERAEATLSNLVTATKTHATSSGLSPISLLDAAASHVSATITELAKTVLIRKATKAEQEQFAHSSQQSMSVSSSFSPTLRTVDELKSSSAHHRKGSSTASNRNRGLETNGSPLGRQYGQSSRRPPSANSSSEHTNSPPPIFDRQAPSGVMSDDSAHDQPDGPEDAWSELKPYLEAQTESIVFAIQSVLSSVRSPVPPPSLNENLTQIITIVSSIVAVSNDNFPPNAVQEGNEILRLLSDHATRLSEVQSLPELTKESRQVMAKSSYEIANAMKSLVRL